MAKKAVLKRVVANRGRNDDLNYIPPKINTLKDLVGFELIDADDNGMIVAKDGKQYKLEFDECDGNCCGYALIKSTLLLKKGMNPVITNVVYNYYDDDDDNGERNKVTITLFGMSKALATIESESGSGSGWCYGATASVECKALGLNEVITQW